MWISSIQQLLITVPIERPGESQMVPRQMIADASKLA
jgi:hypothetical protein